MSIETDTLPNRAWIKAKTKGARMSGVSTQLSPNKSSCTIKVDGDFNFAVHKDFAAAYKALPVSTNFLIDFSTTSYLDSSSLGMLLQLKRYVGHNNDKVKIMNCSPALKDIFTVSKFDKFFTFG